MNYRLLILAIATFAIGTDAFVVAGILPSAASSFGVSIAAAGQLVTAYSLAYAILTPVMAALTAHWPRRRVLLSGLVVFIAGNILTVSQPEFELALVSRAVAGLGAAMVTPVAGAVAAALAGPERRGFALAIVMAGLSGATALGAPIGTLIGSAGNWRLTIWLVAVLGVIAAAGIFFVLPATPSSSRLQLRERLTPLSDARVAVTLATSFLVISGAFLIYTYISAVFDRATGGGGVRLAALVSIWGLAATVGNLAGGSLADRFGSRIVINTAISLLALDFALMPWISTSFAGAAAALVLWGLCGWGFVVAQQHRLVGIASALTPILLGLNASAMYLAISASGAAGALAMHWLSPHDFPHLSMVLVLGGAIGAELAHHLICRTAMQRNARLATASQE